MINTFVKKIFGSRNERVLKRLGQKVKQINALEPSIQALNDAELKAKTDEFRQRLANGETIDQLLPEAFAVVREVSVRTLGMRHFDVQMIGGMVLHGGNIAEMRTGEGKTLMATLPCYLNALSGKGVHVVTVNDYLAKRDREWMLPIYEFLGLSVGVIVPDMPHDAKQAAYACDIVYGTNNEFGFDYLRDNMAFSPEEKVQRELHFAIVDEVDSILIDEARTPLIISGAAEDSSELYIRINKLIPLLKKQETEDGDGDYSVDEKQRQVFLTEAGHQKAEELLVQNGLLNEGESLYSPNNIMLMHHVNAALKAHALFQLDVDYIVQGNEVVIVDEHTGRTMPGRRWSEGLHQAVEAKEGVAIQNENQTLASITFQNFFRLYDKLSGMTGTADTEAYEFQQIYNLEVVVIPTNKPMVRQDQSDLIYINKEAKYRAIIADIKDCVERQQPVLLGTASIESSEYLSSLLNKQKIKHQVLNAKFHEKEAHIIAEAGRPGSVTIATNMAGRGTDIVLGGSLESEIKALGENPDQAAVAELRADWNKRHEAVLKAGGLRIIGSERHESRRIDNQLRGRAGRQGDPGSSCFYLALDDNLMRIFASERVARFMKTLGMEEDAPIASGMVTKAIENAQRKVEGRNFDIRKQLLQYDDVANDQRKVIYSQRAEIMEAESIGDMVAAVRHDVIIGLMQSFIPPESLEEMWDLPGLQQQLANDFGIKIDLVGWLENDDNANEDAIRERLLSEIDALFAAKEEHLGAEVMRQFEKSVMLQLLDNQWREHLAAMDHLRQGIHLRGYAQKDPKQEFKREAFELFSSMLDRLRYDLISVLATVVVEAQSDVDAVEQSRWNSAPREMEYQHASYGGLNAPEFNDDLPEGERVVPFTREEPKVGRNDPCPCGSGKKYKQCHGNIA